jgi:putative transcriptional regulator
MSTDMAIYNKLKILIAQKELREGRKLTYRTVAEEAKISISVLAEYMGQNVKRFDAETLQKLCRYFGIQPGDLLVYTDDGPEASTLKTKASRK